MHSDNFLSAQDVLSRDESSERLEGAVENAKTQLKAIVAQVQTFLDMNQIISAGSFLYGFVKEVRWLSQTMDNLKGNIE